MLIIRIKINRWCKEMYLDLPKDPTFLGLEYEDCSIILNYLVTEELVERVRIGFQSFRSNATIPEEPRKYLGMIEGFYIFQKEN
jgi:hypothetical protein